MHNEDDFEMFFNFHKDGNDNVIIWFAGIDEPFMSESIMKITNCDILTVKDIKNLWYMNGILPDHNGVDDCASWISDKIKYYNKKIFIGQSSGGYAAMLFGNICSADLIIPFSPQTMNVRTGQCDLIPKNKIYNLANLYSKNTESCPIIINIGQSESDHSEEFFWDDWRHIEKFRKFPYVTLIVHPNNNHNTSGILKSKNILYSTINYLIKVYVN